MKREYACYCGLYCGNCSVKAKVEPAARILHEEMDKLGFGQIISFFPDGEKFWSFLGRMTTKGVCVSCRSGSGNPGCRVRLCAREKKVEACALCESYPCPHIEDLSAGYPTLKSDNAVLREQGWQAWGKLQDERQAKGFGFYYENKTGDE